MPTALIAEVVVASVGQVPSTSTRTGFSLMIPFVRMESLLFFTMSYAPFCAANALFTASMKAFDEMVAP